MYFLKITFSFIFLITSHVFVLHPFLASNSAQAQSQKQNPDGSISKLDSNGNVVSTSYPSAPSSGVGSQGANSSSNSNGTQALISMGMNVAMGAMMMKAFSASCSGGATCVWPLLAMGLMSYAQAGGSGSAAGGSFNAADLTNFCPECFSGKVTDYGLGMDGNQSGIFNLDPSMKIPGGPYNTVGELQTAMKGLAGQIKDTGYTIDMENQKLVGPDGTETSFASVNDMATNGTGLSESEFSAVRQALSEAEKNNNSSTYSVAAMDLDNSGGGAGGGANFKFDSLSGESSFSDYLKKLRANRQPAGVAGMKKITSGGDAIGVAGDNIFEMIHRSYQRKRKQNVFLD